MVRLHWFLRATIAIVVGTLPYVIVVGPSPTIPPSWYTALRFHWGEQLTLWLVIVFPGMVTSIVAYGLLTRFWGTQTIDGETHCRKCGYILRGIPEPRCSECGERI